MSKPEYSKNVGIIESFNEYIDGYQRRIMSEGPLPDRLYLKEEPFTQLRIDGALWYMNKGPSIVLSQKEYEQFVDFGWLHVSWVLRGPEPSYYRLGWVHGNGRVFKWTVKRGNPYPTGETNSLKEAMMEVEGYWRDE